MRGQGPGSEHERREADGAPPTPPPSFGRQPPSGQGGPPAYPDDPSAQAWLTVEGQPPDHDAWQPSGAAPAEAWLSVAESAPSPDVRAGAANPSPQPAAGQKPLPAFPGAQPWEVQDAEGAAYDWLADPDEPPRAEPPSQAPPPPWTEPVSQTPPNPRTDPVSQTPPPLTEPTGQTPPPWPEPAGQAPQKGPWAEPVVPGAPRWEPPPAFTAAAAGMQVWPIPVADSPAMPPWPAATGELEPDDDTHRPGDHAPGTPPQGPARHFEPEATAPRPVPLSAPTPADQDTPPPATGPSGLDGEELYPAEDPRPPYGVEPTRPSYDEEPQEGPTRPAQLPPFARKGGAAIPLQPGMKGPPAPLFDPKLSPAAQQGTTAPPPATGPQHGGDPHPGHAPDIRAASAPSGTRPGGDAHPASNPPPTGDSRTGSTRPGGDDHVEGAAHPTSSSQPATDSRAGSARPRGDVHPGGHPTGNPPSAADSRAGSPPSSDGARPTGGGHQDDGTPHGGQPHGQADVPVWPPAPQRDDADRDQLDLPFAPEVWNHRSAESREEAPAEGDASAPPATGSVIQGVPVPPRVGLPGPTAPGNGMEAPSGPPPGPPRGGPVAPLAGPPRQGELASLREGDGGPFRQPPFAPIQVQQPPKSKRALFATLGVLVLAGVATGGFFAVRSANTSAPAAAPVTTPTARPTAEATTPPQPAGTAMLNSEITDPKTLSLKEAFPEKKVEAAGATFTRVKSDVADDCADAASGPFAEALQEQKCSRVLRATYVDRKRRYAVTTGIAVLPSKDAAMEVDQAKNLDRNLWFRGLAGPDGSGGDRVHIAGGYAAGLVWGRYIVFSYATHADGHTPDGKEKTLVKVSSAFRDETAKVLERRINDS